MSILVGILGLLLILIVLQDAFESIVLPRRVARRVRFARLFYTTLWGLWSMIARKMRSSTRREFFLSIFGPLSLLVLLVCWGIILVFAFALIQWAVRATGRSARRCRSTSDRPRRAAGWGRPSR